MSRRRIPLASTATMAGAVRRTRRIRLALAAGVVLAAALAFAAALALRPAKPALVPPGTSGVIVLDVSSSINERTHKQIAHTLASAAGTRDRYGLVVFSDAAYEALPPGTPAAELRAFERLFRPAPADEPTGPGTQGLVPVGSNVAGTTGFPGSRFPPNPWRPGFSAGTKISAGLRLAHRILRRDGIDRGSILLVSDLDSDQQDIPALTQTLVELRAAEVPIRVVALSADSRNRSLFARLLGDPAAISSAPVRSRELDEPPPAFDRPRAPVLLAAAGGLLLLLLAANELLGARLTWRPAPVDSGHVRGQTPDMSRTGIEVAA